MLSEQIVDEESERDGEIGSRLDAPGHGELGKKRFTKSDALKGRNFIVCVELLGMSIQEQCFHLYGVDC